MSHLSPVYADLEKLHRQQRAKAGGRVRLRYWRTMLLAVYQKATSQALERSVLPQTSQLRGRLRGSQRER